MLEDDIQYIGTRNMPAVVAPAPMRPFTSQHGPITGKDRRRKMLFNGRPNEHAPSGVILHVEANSGQPAHDMVFLRSQMSAVTIGRKSTSDNRFGRSDEDLGTAGFVCQVVSGKHAKLAFSDGGMVSSFIHYLTGITNLRFLGVPHRFRIPPWHTHSASW